MGNGPPTGLPAMYSESTAAGMTGRREQSVCMSIRVCYVCQLCVRSGGEGRVPLLLLYKRRQQLLSVVFSLFL